MRVVRIRGTGNPGDSTISKVSSYINAADSPLDGKIRHSHGQRKLGRPAIVTPEEIKAVREATAALVELREASSNPAG